MSGPFAPAFSPSFSGPQSPGLRAAMIEVLTAELDGVTVYPVRLPLGPDVPALTLRFVSDFSGHVHQGVDGLWRRRVQVDIYAEDNDTCDALADQVRHLIDGYRGPWGNFITVGSCMRDNEFDVEEPETGLWRRIQDYLVDYNERSGP